MNAILVQKQIRIDTLSSGLKKSKTIIGSQSLSGRFLWINHRLVKIVFLCIDIKFPMFEQLVTSNELIKIESTLAYKVYRTKVGS
jgi:hypothetical protein